MYFIIDNKLKIIVGWSAKCGCTHIKRICYYLQTNIDKDNIHIYVEKLPLPYDIENYTTILIIRKIKAKVSNDGELKMAKATIATVHPA